MITITEIVECKCFAFIYDEDGKMQKKLVFARTEEEAINYFHETLEFEDAQEVNP